MKKISVVLIEKDEKNIESMLATLESINEIGKTRYSNDIYDLEILLVKKIPQLVLIGPSYSIDKLMEMLSHYNSALGNIKIIIFTKNISSELLKSALKLNIHDVLDYPLNIKDLKESINRASYIFEEQDDAVSDYKQGCKKIMFFSTKGGSGNTFLSVNFAVALKNRTKSEVSIYDLNYQFGDIALMLNIYPKNTIFDLISVNKYDEENLDVFLIRHNSGIKILPAPIDPSQGEAISLDVSSKVLEGLARINDYIIIDAPFDFSEEVVSFIESIDHLMLVATKDVPSIKNLKICLQLLERLNFPKEKSFVILNRADNKVEYEIDEIEKTIHHKIDFKIPNDRIVPVSINKGIPAVINAPRSLISKNVFKMLDILMPENKKILSLRK